MPMIRLLVSGMLLSAVATGCAARYQPPAPGDRHALLVLPSPEAQLDRGMFLEPLAMNGLTRPRNWLVERFRVPPGQFRLLARAAQDAVQGSCLLQFDAVAGETYLLDAERVDGMFTLSVSHGGEVVAECSAPATVLPTPARIPGAPAR